MTTFMIAYKIHCLPEADFIFLYTVDYCSSNLEIHKPTTEKSHVSDISLKVYMAKTIICCVRAMSIVTIVFYSCMVTTCTCTCTAVSKNSWSSRVSMHKESSRMWPNLLGETLFWCRAFIAYSKSAWPCYLPWSYTPCTKAI